MKIVSEAKTNSIEIIKLESVYESYPSYRIELKIDTQKVKATHDNFTWVSLSDIETFLSQLEYLDKYRNQEAVLESMSPGEMRLIFKPLDSLGHLLVKLEIGKVDHINREYSYNVSVEFRIDPTALPYIKQDFIALTR